MSGAGKLIRLLAKEYAEVLEKPVREKAPAHIRARSGTPAAIARDVLAEAAKPSKDAPFARYQDRSGCS